MAQFAPDTFPTDPEPALRLVDPAVNPAADVQVHRGRSSHVHVETVETSAVPQLVPWAFGVLVLATIALALHQLFDIGGSGRAAELIFDHGLNDLVFFGSAALTVWRATRIRAERAAWWCIAAGLALYCSGDIVWSLFFAQSDATVTLADAFYLCWAPLTLLGLVLLVRSRISTFELDRWVDGLAAALLISAPGAVLILGPTANSSSENLLTKIVSVAYPAGDLIVLGAIVGAIALSGWRPGRAWIVLALGVGMFVVADSIYAIQALDSTYQLGQMDFLWPAAGLLIAIAAWLRPVRHVKVHAWGWQAIALPVLCQIAPIVLMFLTNQSTTEKLLMMGVMTIVMVQIVVTRPRKPDWA